MRTSASTFIPPFRMSLNADRITNLPTPLQSLILSNISSVFPRRSFPITIDTANNLMTPLPHDLLSVAKSSSALAEAAADALGASAQVLSGDTAKPLHEWVTALAPFVKAVSLWDSNMGRNMRLSGSRRKQAFFDEKFEETIEVFNALSTERFRLQVLDVGTIMFQICSAKEELFKPFVAALQRSRESLKELGLMATPLSVRAIESVCLPNLQVVELGKETHWGSRDASDHENGATTEVYMDMLRALEGHADRVEKKTTLRELRFLHMFEPPCVTPLESCAGLFKAVKVLKLEVSSHSMAKFISLFPNLECLHWNVAATPDLLHTILDTCKGLKEIHLHSTQRPGDRIGFDESKLAELYTASRGTLRSLVITEELTIEQLRILGENNPELEALNMDFGRDNVAGLPLLLGTHCRKLRTLGLYFSVGEEDCLGAEGWCTFRDAVTSASEELCEISMAVDDDRTSIEMANEAMTQGIVDIVEFLGERARRLSFALPMGTTKYSVLIATLRRLMLACETHASNLECLILNLTNGDFDYEYETDEENKEMFEQLLADKERMMAALPRLETLYLGIDENASDWLREFEEGLFGPN